MKKNTNLIIKALSVSLLLVFLFGTSRPLAYKKMVGIMEILPDVFKLKGTPQSILGENRNNQGCSRDDGLDLYVEFCLNNVSSERIALHEQDVSFQIDGRVYAIQQQSYYAEGEKRFTSFREYVIPPEDSLTIKLYSQSCLQTKDLVAINEIKAIIPWQSEKIVIKFEKIKNIPVQKGFWHIETL